MNRSERVDAGLSKSPAVLVLSNIRSTDNSLSASFLDQFLGFVGTIDRFCVFESRLRTELDLAR
jgi:hypothetical protein